MSRWERAQKAEMEYHAKHNGTEGAWSKAEQQICRTTFDGSVLEVGCTPNAAIHKLRADYRAGIDPIDYPHECEVEHDVGLAEQLPFPDKSFDTVLCLNALDHMLDPQKALLEMRRVARGQLILSLNVFPLPKRLRAKMGDYDTPHPFHFSEGELRGMLLDAGFKVEKRTSERMSLWQSRSVKTFLAWGLGMRLVTVWCR